MALCGGEAEEMRGSYENYRQPTRTLIGRRSALGRNAVALSEFIVGLSPLSHSAVELIEGHRGSLLPVRLITCKRERREVLSGRMVLT